MGLGSQIDLHAPYPNKEYIRTHKNVAGKTKQFILLLNKADLLSKKQRHAWAHYFMKCGLRFIYFSAGTF